jgi:hypothetical protein
MIEMGTLVDDADTDNPLWVDIVAFPTCTVGGIQPGHPAECLFDRPWTEDELDEPQYIVTNGSATAVTHDGGMPADCQQLVEAWTRGADSDDDGYWIVDNFADISAPSGGLFGGAAVVNVQAGAMYSYDAKAIDGFYVAGEGTYEGDDSHQEPGTILPSLDSGNSASGTVFTNGATQDSVALARGVDAVSYVFMHDAIMNEYTTESAVGAATEWVISFPTKQFYVHQSFLDDIADFRDNGELDGSDSEDPKTAPRVPFTSEWEWVLTTYETVDEVKVVDEPGYVDYPCEVVTLDTIYDREEATIIPPDAPPGTVIPPIVSPAPPPVEGPSPDGIIPFELCYETSVIAFGSAKTPKAATSILGSGNFHTIDNTELGFEYGWARLDMVNATSDTDGSGVIEDDEVLFREHLGGLFGLPVTGFAVQRFENAFLGDGADVLANYGGIFQHKGTRSAD